MKVLKTKKIGFVDVRKILPGDYETSIKWFKDNYDIDLPARNISPFPDSQDLWILLEDVELRVYEKVGVHVYTFKKGFQTDLASIPSLARSFVDNDANYIFLGALKHDSDFRWKFRSFVSANEEFLQIMKINGASWLQRLFTRLGIYTSIAKKAYRNPIMGEEFKRVTYEWRPK